MPIGKITKRAVDDLAPERDGDRPVLWDTEVKGFGCRFGGVGAKTYIFQYRSGSGRKAPTRVYRIGLHGTLTPAKARQRAQVLAGLVKAGKDPQLEKFESRRRGDTVEEVFSDFAVRHLVNLRTGKQVRSAFDANVIPEIGRKRLDTIKRRDLIAILDKIEARGAPIMVNRTIAYLHKFFVWCVSKDLLEANPATGLAKPAKDTPRSRVLSDEELIAIWHAAGKIGGPFGDLVRLLILTGQRLNEVARLPWSEVDLDGAMWTLPAARTKNKRDHLVPLSAQTIAILKSAPRQVVDEKPSPFVLTTNGRTPISGFSKWKTALDAKLKDGQTKVAPWRLHDLRRTMTTRMAESLGVAPHVADKVLNHAAGSISGVAAIYNKAQYLDERKRALTLWASYVDELVNLRHAGDRAKSDQRGKGKKRRPRK